MYCTHNNNRIMYYLLRALCAFYSLVQVCSSAENVTPGPRVFECDNILPQDTIHKDKIIGRWYVIEIVQHKSDDRWYHGEKIQVATCPYIYLSYVNEYNDTELKFFWEENEGDLEYRFKINDKSSPGTWISSGAQNGSLVRLGYDQFAGTVTIRKAVKDHMWLQFCSPNTQLYSLVVARDKWLDRKELKSIMKIMEQQNIAITQRKQTCKSSSSNAQVSVWLLVVAAVLCFRLSVLAYKTN